MGKILFEKWWLTPNGVKRYLWGSLLKLGGKIFGIPVDL